MFTKSHTKNSLRFRYWSRKGYAAFKSIGKHVTIGNLKNVVADALLGKQKNLFATQVARPTSDEACTFAETNEPPQEKIQLPILLLLPVQHNDFAYCETKNLFKQHQFIWLKACVIAFSHFF